MKVEAVAVLFEVFGSDRSLPTLAVFVNKPGVLDAWAIIVIGAPELPLPRNGSVHLTTRPVVVQVQPVPAVVMLNVPVPSVSVTTMLLAAIGPVLVTRIV